MTGMKNLGVAIAAATVAVAGFADAARRSIPDRVDIDPTSKDYWPHYRKIGVRIDGVSRPGDVLAFCVSEGWAMIKARNPVTGRFIVNKSTGTFARLKVMGVIEPYWRETPSRYTAPSRDDELHKQKAAEKRARKAAARRKQMPSK